MIFVNDMRTFVHFYFVHFTAWTRDEEYRTSIWQLNHRYFYTLFPNNPFERNVMKSMRECVWSASFKLRWSLSAGRHLTFRHLTNHKIQNAFVAFSLNGNHFLSVSFILCGNETNGEKMHSKFITLAFNVPNIWIYLHIHSILCMYGEAKAKEKKKMKWKVFVAVLTPINISILCLCVPICAQSSQCVQVIFFFQVEVYGYRRKEREKKIKLNYHTNSYSSAGAPHTSCSFSYTATYNVHYVHDLLRIS